MTRSLTRLQCAVVIDALDLFIEGSMGQETQRELRDARSARRKVARQMAVFEMQRARA